MALKKSAAMNERGQRVYMESIRSWAQNDMKTMWKVGLLESEGKNHTDI